MARVGLAAECGLLIFFTMAKPPHPELKGYESHPLYTFELKKRGQTRRDRLTWSLLGISIGLGMAIGGYTALQLWDWSAINREPTEADPYAQATTPAMEAAELTQTAESREDWVNVALQWQEAIRHMKSVPEQHASHAQAQTKIAEYTRNLEYAQSNVSTRTAANPKQQIYWTVGSDRDQVVAVQGVPFQVVRHQNSCQEILYYGNSTVELDNGYVKTYNNIDNNLNALAGNTVVLSVQPQVDRWGLGSSRTDVISTQGTPTRTEDYGSSDIETFYYGNSSVTLNDNRVISYFNLDNNLKASLQPGLPSDEQTSTWTVGSSRTEVLRAQGQTPIHVSRNDNLCEEVYYFGEAEVYFRQGWVSGYKQSAQTLRLR